LSADFVFVSRFCQQIFAVSRFCFRKQILSEDFLRQQICFLSANVLTLVNKTTLAPANPFSRQPDSLGKDFLLRRARIFAAITIALVLPDLGVLSCTVSVFPREVRQNQVSSRSFYIQLIPGRGARPDLPGRSGPSTYTGVKFDRRNVRASHGLAGMMRSFR
jgi:hypothetical protein